VPRDWTTAELRAVAAARELEIAPGADAERDRWTPIWAVRADDGVYVRTWYRRTTGWYGRAARAGRASVRVPGMTSDVVVEDVGDTDPGLRAAVDAAYVEEYGGGGSDRMVGDEAAGTTLRLSPA